VKGDLFAVRLTVRASDLNYANHVGYQNYLSYFQEARLAYLKHLGYLEHDIEGCGIIVAEVVCRYKQELYLNDAVHVGCRISRLRSKGFRIDYHIRRNEIICAEGYTDCLCYAYDLKKVVKLPEAFVDAVKVLEGI
jgi:acyl-CoA thioester hydrolase